MLDLPFCNKQTVMKPNILLTGILSLAIITTSAFGQTTPAKTKTVKSATKSSTKKPTGTSTSKSPTKAVTTGETTKPASGGRNVGGTTGATNSVAKPTGGQATEDNPFQQLEAQAAPVVEEMANGQINYTEQYIEAKGASVIDNERFKNPAQARLMAERGAIVVAQRNLLEMVKGVQVIGETTVQDMITTGDYVYTRVEGVVKGFKAFGPAREVNGTMEVTLRMPLYDKAKGVTAGFSNEGLNNARRRAGVNEESPDVASSATVDESSPIAFNVGGAKIDASMFPVVVDENGKVLLDFSKIYQKTGKVPKIVQSTKEIFDAAGFKKGTEIIDLVQNTVNGTFTLADPAKKKKVNWGKIGNIAATVGKVLLNILL